MIKAKPFPTQIRIGADLAHIPRFADLIQRRIRRKENRNDADPHFDRAGASDLEYWARRVISRLEWPRFRFYLNALAMSNLTRPDPDIWPMAQWLASRWAAKEAAIKAHSHRRLFMPHISIIKEKGNLRPIMLIDPPNSLVCMTAAIAEKRGVSMNTTQKLDRFKIGALGLDIPAEEEGAEPKYWRYKRIRMEERQLADLSISHEDKYAFAVVQALDEPVETVPSVTEDDGTGDSIHEPQFGDKGYFNLGPSFTKTEKESSLQDYMLESRR